jgi:hypothetical protein
VNKKEQKWLKRQAEKEKAESEARRKAIVELTHAIEELVSGRKKLEELEGIIAEAKTLAQQWKDPHSAKDPKNRRPLFDETTADRTFLLVGLIVALRRDRDHTFFERIRRGFLSELEKLSGDTIFPDGVASPSLLTTLPKPTSKQAYERKRHSWHRNFSNSIEYQFGGGLEADLRKRPSSLFRPDDSSYKSVLSSIQTCLDDIFAHEPVNMQGLEDLFFGIERHRLAKLVSREDKKPRKYGHRVVVKIMHALLSEKPRKKRKRSTPGRPRQMPWLNDADLRTRVLSGIEGRIMSIATELREIDQDEARQWQEEIANPFLAIVRRPRQIRVKNRVNQGAS